MNFYLRVLNPAIALLILCLCFWAATFEDGEFKLLGVVGGGLNTYFFAKGLFSCSAVFILGKILLGVFSDRDRAVSSQSSRAQIVYSLSILGLAVSVLLGVALTELAVEEKKSETVEVTNPPEIEIMESYRILETKKFRLGGTLKNRSERTWEPLMITATVFVGGKLVDRCTEGISKVGPREEVGILMSCFDLYNDRIKNEVEYKLDFKGTIKKE